MDKNLDPIAKELFGKIRTQFPKIKLGDANSNVTDRPKDARFFEFDFVKNGKNLGSISISIADAENEAAEDDLADNDGMVVMYSNEITDDQPDSVKRQWFNFLRELREFAKQKMMHFSIRDITKKNLDKRDYQHLAKNNGDGSMTESKLWGTSKTSYQQMGEAKLIVRHTQPVNYAHAAGRTLHIESIHVENSQGERFKYPVKHLNGARALATHVAHGGTPYDGIGQHITGLSEELNKLRMFKGYVDRNSMVSEAMGTIQTKVYERIDQVKKEIRSLQNQSYYQSFAESFVVNEAQEIPEDVVNDWIDRLTIRSFNEELKNVFPYIYKLVGEEVDVIKELTAEDLLGEDGMDEGYYKDPDGDDESAEDREDKKDNEKRRREEDGMDEGAKWRDPKYKDKLYTQEPDDGEGDRHDYYYDTRPDNDPGEKHSTFNRRKDTDKLHYDYGDYQVGQKAKVGDRAKKGLLTKNAIRVVKDRIRGTQGDHPTPNLPEEDQFEAFLNDLVSEESDLFNTDEESQSASIQTLNQLIAQEFPVGADGTNAIQSLQGIIDDQEFTDAIKQLGKVNPEMDIREFLKSYLEKHDEENGTDIASKINFDSTTPAPTEPVAAAPAPAAAPVDPAAAPVDPAAAAVPAAPAPVAEEKEDPPFDPDPPKKDGDKDQFGNTIKNKARHLAKKGMAAAIAKAKKAGATAETMVNFGSGEMSLGEAITKAGMDVEEFFEGTGKQNEVVEFVKSMYDETTGNFPKGETGVLLAVEKQFGEDAAKMAHSVISELSQVYESKRLRQLAGITEAGLGGMNMDVDQMFKNMSNTPGATKTSNFKSTIDGKQDDSEAGYNAAMGKFRDMAGGMGFGADGENPASGMMKGIQDKFGNMTKGMNMPTMPGAPAQAPTQSAAPTPTKQDPKTMLKALPDAKLSTMSGDEAKKMLADLKKMAGI
jgi:hypothetical protein